AGRPAAKTHRHAWSGSMTSSERLAPRYGENPGRSRIARPPRQSQVFRPTADSSQDLGNAMLSSVRRIILTRFPDAAICQSIREELCLGTAGDRQRSLIRGPFAAGIDRAKKREMASR